MKIKYFKLENFAGIKYGINNSVFELNDIPNGIIMLQGDNGSGKSTTLHTLHIFSDDKSFLIKNEDGSYIPAKKELIVEHNGIEYHIVHQYSKSGSKKSFIKKKEEELNGAGNVATFEHVILQEFGIENNTVSNSVIGVSQINFIDLTSSERKKEIATLLPNISEYEKAYKLSNDNLNGCKKQIQMLSQLISESGGSEMIQNKMIEINSKIEPIANEVKELENNNIQNGQNLAVLKSKYDSLMSEIGQLKLDLDSKKIEYDNYKAKVSSFTNPPKELDMNILISKKDVANNNYNSKVSEKQEINNKIALMNNQWSNYQKQLDLKNNMESNKSNLINNINKLEEEINLLNKELNESKNVNIKPYYTQDVLNDIITVGKSIKEELDSIKNVYNISIDNKSELELYSNINDLYNKTKLYTSKQEELNKYRSFIGLFSNMSNNTNNKDLENISLTDGCSFSKCSIQYKVLLDLYNKKCYELETTLNNNLDKFNQYNSFIKIYERFSPSYSNRYNLGNIIGLNKEDFDIMNLPNTLVKLRSIKDEISNFIYNSNTLNEKEKYIQSKVEYLNQLKSNLNNMQDIILEELSFTQNDILLLQSQLSDKDKEILSCKTKLDQINKEIIELTEYSKLDVMNIFINNYENNLSIYQSKSNELNSINNQIMNTQNTINSIISLISSKNETLLSYNKEIKELEERLAVINDQVSNKNKLDTEIEQRNMVTSALHPTKGIASLLVKSYLTSIENICNEILSKTFDSSYNIFLENLEKDFFVRIFEKSTNRYIEDVKLCSSGQQAIVKLVLSIALNKCATNDVIYLRLDECDSVLSKDNLIMVETLLNSLLNKFGIEQVFIVTHNSSISVADSVISFDRDEQTYKVS